MAFPDRSQPKRLSTGDPQRGRTGARLVGRVVDVSDGDQRALPVQQSSAIVNDFTDEKHNDYFRKN